MIPKNGQKMYATRLIQRLQTKSILDRLNIICNTLHSNNTLSDKAF